MFGNFFKSRPLPTPSHPAGEQAVLLYAVLLYLEGEDFDRMVELSDKLTEAVEKANVGMLDGNEIGGGETTLFMYGPDAEAVFRAIEPVLLQEESARGAKATIRWGNPGSPQREIVIGSKNHQAQ
jgi:hypothetical protein